MSTKTKAVYNSHVFRNQHGIVVPGLLEHLEPFVGHQVKVTVERTDCASILRLSEMFAEPESVPCLSTQQMVSDLKSVRALNEELIAANSEMRRSFYEAGSSFEEVKKLRHEAAETRRHVAGFERGAGLFDELMLLRNQVENFKRSLG
jgi:hypothetical protein